MATLLRSATDTFKEVLVIYFFVLAVSAVVFSFAEDKPLFDSVYWASATAMTIGYGDITPATVIGRLDAMVTMHISVLFIAPVIVARLLMYMTEDKNAFTDEEQKEILRLLRETREKVE